MTEFRGRISKKLVLQALAEKRGQDAWEKIVNFTNDERFPSRLPFGKVKNRRVVKAENLKC